MTNSCAHNFESEARDVAQVEVVNAESRLSQRFQQSLNAAAATNTQEVQAVGSLQTALVNITRDSHTRLEQEASQVAMLQQRISKLTVDAQDRVMHADNLAAQEVMLCREEIKEARIHTSSHFREYKN